MNNASLAGISTITKLRALYDNYELDTKTIENVTTSEMTEEVEFINNVLDTQVMKAAMNYLQQQGCYLSNVKIRIILFKKRLFIFSTLKKVLYERIVRVK